MTTSEQHLPVHKDRPESGQLVKYKNCLNMKTQHNVNPFKQWRLSGGPKGGRCTQVLRNNYYFKFKSLP
jgi:hypothetical protein